MPIYEYHCEKCGHEFEVLQKSFDVDEMPCETCGATAKRMISNTSFVLKGTGWYVTDYKSNGGCSAAGGNNGKSHSHGDKAEKSETPSTPCASAGSNGNCASCSGAKASGSPASAGTAAN